MDNDFIFPKWLCRVFSYVAVFTCGAYTYGAVNGKPPTADHVVPTIVFGLFFFILSLPDKKKGNF